MILVVAGSSPVCHPIESEDQLADTSIGQHHLGGCEMAVLLLLAAVACLAGGVVKAVQHDWVVAAVLLVAGVILWPGAVIT